MRGFMPIIVLILVIITGSANAAKPGAERSCEISLGNELDSKRYVRNGSVSRPDEEGSQIFVKSYSLKREYRTELESTPGLLGAVEIAAEEGVDLEKESRLAGYLMRSSARVQENSSRTRDPKAPSISRVTVDIGRSHTLEISRCGTQQAKISIQASMGLNPFGLQTETGKFAEVFGDRISSLRRDGNRVSLSLPLTAKTLRMAATYLERATGIPSGVRSDRESTYGYFNPLDWP